MADKGRQMDTVFFIYDHNVLKKEEDDLKDAILFFSPSSYSIDERCALCGQLMGMSEFMSATICKSAPKVFRFEHEKYVFLHPGAYSLGLRGGAYTPDTVLQTQLNTLYETFVTYHGTIDSLKLRYKGTAGGFLQELDNIWKTILTASGITKGPSLTQTFQALPYVRLPKTGSHLFLQASHLLQSSQRRPYVLAGTILYKNRVLSTQLPPSLTRHLTYLHNQVPHIVRKTGCDLPKGCRIITVFLTDDELSEIDPLNAFGTRHCKVTDFSIKRNTEVMKRHSTTTGSNKQHKPISRRLTCPNISSTVHKQNNTSVPQKALQSFIVNEKRKKTYQVEQDSLRVEKPSWGISKSPRMSLSHVPIVECKTGESHCESEDEKITLLTRGSNFGEKFHEISPHTDNSNEMSESDSESSERSPDTALVPKPNVSKYTDDLNTKLVSDHCDTHSEGQKETLSKNDSDLDNKNGNCVENKEKSDVDMSGSVQSSEKTVTLGTDVPNSKESLAVEAENSTKSDLNVKVQIGDSDIKETNNTGESTHVREEDTEAEKTVLGPSISDIEESDDDSADKTDTDRNQEGHKTVTKSISVSIEEHVNIGANNGIEDSSNSNSSKLASNDLHVPEMKIISSTSSEDAAEMRFYDKMPTDKTETLKKDSNHAVYEHHVEVHADSTGNSVEEESAATKCDLGNDGTTQTENMNEMENSRDSEKSGQNLIGSKFHDKQMTTPADLREQKDLLKSSVQMAEIENIQQGENKLFDAHRYESEVETEDESVTIAMIEPCINCLDLVAKQSQDTNGQTATRCSKCITNYRQKMMFGALGNDKEVIDFGDSGPDRQYESGAETDGGVVIYDRNSSSQDKVDVSSSHISSLSSDISTDSTISQYWTHEMDGLNDLTLYVQCHSDISLLLLMANPDQYEENLFHALWKGSLAYLADLDFYIKECTEVSDDDEDELPNPCSYGYLKFDSYAAELKGNIGDPGVDKRSQNLQQMLTTLHAEFQHDLCLSDITLRSNFNSCYGHSTSVEETYFQPELQQKMSSGFPIPRDPVFNLDVVAKQHLARDKHLSLI